MTKLQGLDITEDQQREVTVGVLKALFEKETKKYATTIQNITDRQLDRLNKTRREADLGNDAFTRLNVLQENVVRFGQARLMVKVLNKETKSAEIRYLTVGGNENKFGAVKINKIITEEYLKLVG